jgi:acyl-coenzyme A synthetase/AMP-(fatty) acid ligase
VQGDPKDGGLIPAVLRRCRQRLPSYAQPAEVVVVAEFPLNANGKVDESALRATMP